jgi:hypothetical protein
MVSYPGLTECDETLVLKEVPFAPIQQQEIHKRKIILLATAAINEGNIFSNGLFQNVYVYYKMFESMGFCPILIVNDKPTINGFVVIITTKTNKKVPRYSANKGNTVFIYYILRIY